MQHTKPIRNSYVTKNAYNLKELMKKSKVKVKTFVSSPTDHKTANLKYFRTVSTAGKEKHEIGASDLR